MGDILVSGAMKRILIIGAGGRLGAALAREYASEFDVVGFNHAQLDLGKPEQLRATLGGLKFDALINTAAQTNVDRCETHQEEAFALNAEAPRILAGICAEKRARFVHISTDYVFDGEKRTPYTEEDEARPISVYGESKREGERHALEANAQTLIVRVSWVFGPDRQSFIDWALSEARKRDDVKAIADKWATTSSSRCGASARSSRESSPTTTSVSASRGARFMRCSARTAQASRRS